MKRIQMALSFLLMLIIFFIVSTDLCAQDYPECDPEFDPDCFIECDPEIDPDCFFHCDPEIDPDCFIQGDVYIDSIYPNAGQSILNNKPVIQATIFSFGCGSFTTTFVNS